MDDSASKVKKVTEHEIPRQSKVQVKSTLKGPPLRKNTGPLFPLKTCEINSNLDAIQYYLQPSKPYIFLHTETQLSLKGCLHRLLFPGY